MTAHLRRANDMDPEFGGLRDPHTDFPVSLSSEGWAWAVIAASLVLAGAFFLVWRARRR